MSDICPICLSNIEEKKDCELPCHHKIHIECHNECKAHGYSSCSICRQPFNNVKKVYNFRLCVVCIKKGIKVFIKIIISSSLLYIVICTLLKVIGVIPSDIMIVVLFPIMSLIVLLLCCYSSLCNRPIQEDRFPTYEF